MRLFSVFTAGICLLFICPLTAARGVNGGINCAVCTAFIAILEQLMNMKNFSVLEALDEICTSLPDPFQKDCRKAANYLEPLLFQLILFKNGPDVICHTLRICRNEPGESVCKAIVPPFESLELPFDERVKRATQLVHHHLLKFPSQLLVCDIPGINTICKWIERSLVNRRPMTDKDKDGFSPTLSFRGAAWRGKDCSDRFPNIHPGAKPLHSDIYVDSNCNGIYGVNNVTKEAYEDELCSKSEPRGVVALGDSISAHFSLPPSWIDATKISKDAFKHLKMILENEIDWPMLSTLTGHVNNTWTEVINGPMDSIYQRMVKRNRCNHRDYQNIAENGEESFNIHQLMKTMSRNPTKDRPVLISFALIGNDICRGAPGTLANMTTPKQMYENTMMSLKYLNGHVPVGSYVVIMGLADGRVLYDFMGGRIHPIGTFWQDFTYSQFYDYMNCLKISPCPAWMNSDEAIRNKAKKRVDELNNVLQDLAKKHKNSFSNFKLVYLENPFKRVIRKWLQHGGFGWQLVEPSDGFHSNQMGQALTAKVMWDMLEHEVPEALGPVNPHNHKIQQLFGDQGGM